MTPISDFRTYVAPHVPGASDMVIDRAIVDAAIELCEESLIVKQTITFPTEANKPTYTPVSPSGERVTRIHRLWVDGREIAGATDDVTDAFDYQQNIGDKTASPGFPKRFYEASDGVIGLAYVPDKVYTVTARVALKPSRKADQLEDLLFEDWAETIADGALARLFAQLSQPWGSPPLAAAHNARFRVGINRALIEANRQFTRGELTISVPRIV